MYGEVEWSKREFPTGIEFVNNFLFLIHYCFTLHCICSSSSDVTIRTILHEGCYGALVTMIATPFLKVFIAPRYFLKASLNDFFLVNVDNFFTTKNSDSAFQLKSTIGLRLVWNFYNVAIFKWNCWLWVRSNKCEQDQQKSWKADDKLSRSHFFGQSREQMFLIRWTQLITFRSDL